MLHGICLYNLKLLVTCKCLLISSYICSNLSTFALSCSPVGHMVWPISSSVMYESQEFCLHCEKQVDMFFFSFTHFTDFSHYLHQQLYASFNSLTFQFLVTFYYLQSYIYHIRPLFMYSPTVPYFCVVCCCLSWWNIIWYIYKHI